MKTKKNPEAVKQNLDQIAENLWKHHASVFVGAGFSKNAKVIDGSSRTIPDWSELGNAFYKKLNGKENDKAFNADEVTKLAQDVEDKFKRPSLDSLICECIDDKPFVPSELHKYLLELPWTDVFTTNYDTLLERAQEKVEFINYETVCSAADFTKVNHPRIVKLHGPFQNKQSKYIITEKDYQCYPKDYAIFVNEIRHNLIENIFCLIGFSGDDPNFISWIDWILDNIGSDARPVYFITVKNSTQKQEHKLDEKKIKIVNLSEMDEIAEGDYEQGFTYFLKYLNDKKPDDKKLHWAEFYGKYFSSRRVEKIGKAQILSNWQEQRKAYPGWIVLPEDQRRILWLYTDSWTRVSCIEKEYTFQLSWADELLWRMEKCLMPLFPNQISDLGKLTDTFFCSFLSDKTFCNPAVIQKSVHVCIALLKSYREDGDREKWSTLNSRLDTIFTYIEPEQQIEIYYERCLSAFFTLDSKKVNDALLSWPENRSFPFWEVKRAGLIAELGKVNDALEIVESALSDIRSALKNNPDDYKVLSQESYCIKLYMILKRVVTVRQSDADKQEFVKLQRRQVELISDNCDPDAEIQFFTHGVNLDEPVKAETISYTFDIGKKLTVEDFRKNDGDILHAYQFFNFLEVSGLPVHIDSLILSTKQAAEESILKIVNCSPVKASVMLVRLHDVKLIEKVYPRSVVSRMSVERADTTIRTYLSLLKNARTSIAVADNTSVNYPDSALAGMIPELLSRFVTKCSTSVRDETLDWIISVYTTEDWRKYQNLQVVLMRLLKSYSVQELYERIPKFLLIPLPENPSISDESRRNNPFLFMSFSGKHLQRKPVPRLPQDTVNHLLAQVSSDKNYVRNWAVTTIDRLAGLGLLSASQKKEYGTALWSKRDSDGFPKGTDFYHFAFLLMPHPETVQPEEVFLKYMEKSTFPIRGNTDGYEVTNGNIPVCHNILGAGESIDFSIDEIRLLLQKITGWWQADKKYISSSDDNGTRQEFRLRFAEMIEVLSRVVVPVVAAEGAQAQISELAVLVKEIQSSGIPCANLSVSWFLIDTSEKKQVLSSLENSFATASKEVLSNSLLTVSQMCIFYRKNKKIIGLKDISQVLEGAARKIYWRDHFMLPRTLTYVGYFLSRNYAAVNCRIEQMLLSGLSALADETDPTLTVFDFDEALDIRLQAVGVAKLMYNHYINKKKEVPESLRKWENIATLEKSKDEFAEIRNKWSDT
jgi:hypothetical protein